MQEKEERAKLLRSDYTCYSDSDIIDVLAEFLALYADPKVWEQNKTEDPPHRKGMYTEFRPNNVVDGYRFAQEGLEALKRYKEKKATTTSSCVSSSLPLVTRVSYERFFVRPEGLAFEEKTQLIDGCVSGPKPKQLTEDWHTVVIYQYKGFWYRLELVIHAGLFHDGSSVPRVSAAVFGFDWRKVYKAGVLHDLLYQSGVLKDRGEADRVWRVVATNGDNWKVKPWQGKLGEQGLKIGGGKAWKGYRRRQEEREKKMRKARLYD